MLAGMNEELRDMPFAQFMYYWRDFHVIWPRPDYVQNPHLRSILQEVNERIRNRFAVKSGNSRSSAVFAHLTQLVLIAYQFSKTSNEVRNISGIHYDPCR